MLKDELDVIIRQKILDSSIQSHKGNLNPKADILTISQKQVNERALKDALFVWEKLKNIFRSTVNPDTLFGITSVDVCFCTDSKTPHAFSRVFATPSGSIWCYRIHKKKIKYVEETLSLVCLMAKVEGLSIKIPKYEEEKLLPRNTPIFEKAMYSWNPTIKGKWINFTYQAPETK